MPIISATGKGRLYIGQLEDKGPAKCLGRTVRVYTDPLTKCITKLFGCSVQVDIGGKSRCVNKNSLIKHLQSLELAPECVAKMQEVGYDALIAQNECSPLQGAQNFGDSLPEAKRCRITRRMCKALLANDTEAVKRYIRKGASCDGEFYVGPTSSSFDVYFDKSQLERELQASYACFSCYGYTPLAMAAQKGNLPLAQFIADTKGGVTDSDKRQTFSWENISFGYPSAPYWRCRERTEQKVKLTASRVSLV